MGQRGHIMVQKGLKMHKKAKIEFLDLKRRFFSLAELGGTPPTLNGQSLCSKKLRGKGRVPPLLNGKNPLSSL